MKKSLILKPNSPAALILFIGSFCAGIFYEGVCAALGIVLVALIAFKAVKEKRLYIEKSLATLTAFAVSFGFLAATLWGYDKFNSLLGFAKFLPLFLFWVLINQYGREKNETALSTVPLAGVIMTAVSVPLTYVPKVAELFSVKGRASGFFQYPSTFALFLIIGIILLAMQEKFDFLSLIFTAVLVAGVFFSGSRTSFIVLLIALLGVTLFSKNKKLKLFVVAVTAVIVVAAIVLSVLNKGGAFNRFLTISLSSATLKGRLLYITDALKFTLKHPFGIGYMGYYFAQGSFQTGLYSNTYVHNELLQIMLDIGWVPALLAVACAVKALVSKNVAPYKKLIIAVCVIHSMLDFDLQYLVIGFILLLCVYEGEEKAELERPVPAVLTAVLAVFCIVNVYTGSSSLAYQLNNSEAAVKICKYNTMAQLDALNATESAKIKNQIADTVLKNNKHISNAYSAKAFYYYSDGDIEKAIEFKQLALDNNRYFAEEYEDYAVMLINSINAYAESDDYDSAMYCIDKLDLLMKRIESVKASTSKLAYDLPDKPDIDLPEEYSEAIEYYISLKE